MGAPSNRTATLESQMIPMIQDVPGQTLRSRKSLNLKNEISVTAQDFKPSSEYLDQFFCRGHICMPDVKNPLGSRLHRIQVTTQTQTVRAIRHPEFRILDRAARFFASSS